MSFLVTAGEIIGFLIISIFAIVKSIVTFFIPVKYRMKSVSGDIVLVTGGGGGLGRLLSLRFSNLGAIIVVWDINKAGIEETVKLVQAAGGTCYGYICDLCDREDVYKKAAILEKEVGKVSILINNAGVVSGTKLLDTPDSWVVRCMDVNIMSHFWTVKAFLPKMMKDNKGHIVSIASLAGHVGVPKLVDYCASKFAAVGFDEALRMELESEGYDIKTTVICPYFIRSTGMFDSVNLRFVPNLSVNDVAERVVTAIRCNEKYAIIPSYMQTLLLAKWIFPWSCAQMFLRGLVTDVNPTTQIPKNVETVDKNKISSVPAKDQNGGNIHQQLARRISSSERKP